MNEMAENRDMGDELPERGPQLSQVIDGIKVPRAATEWGCRRINDSGFIEPLAYGHQDDGTLATYWPISDLSLSEVRTRWGGGNYQFKFFKRSAHNGLVNATGTWTPIYRLEAESVAPPVQSAPPLPPQAPPQGPPQAPQGTLPFPLPSYPTQAAPRDFPSPPQASPEGARPEGFPHPSQSHGAPSHGRHGPNQEGFQVPPAPFEPPQALLSPLRDPAWHTRVVFEHARQLMQVHHAQYMETLRLFSPGAAQMHAAPNPMQGLIYALLPKALDLAEKLVARLEAGPQAPPAPPLAPSMEAMDPRLLEFMTAAKAAMVKTAESQSDGADGGDDEDEDDEDEDEREPSPGELFTRFWEATDPETQGLLAKGVMELPEAARSTLVGLIKAAVGS